jgi:hypothetical protein
VTYWDVKTRRRRQLAAVVMCGVLPLLMGGCPELQNEVVTAVETAVRGIADAALDLFFEQYRSSRAG